MLNLCSVVDEGDDKQETETDFIEEKRTMPSWKIPKIKKPSKPWCSCLGKMKCSSCSPCSRPKMSGCLSCSKVRNTWKNRTTHITCVCCAKRQMDTIDPVIQFVGLPITKPFVFQKKSKNVIHIIKKL